MKVFFILVVGEEFVEISTATGQYNLVNLENRAVIKYYSSIRVFSSLPQLGNKLAKLDTNAMPVSGAVFLKAMLLKMLCPGMKYVFSVILTSPALTNYLFTNLFEVHILQYVLAAIPVVGSLFAGPPWPVREDLLDKLGDDDDDDEEELRMR